VTDSVKTENKRQWRLIPVAELTSFADESVHASPGKAKGPYLSFFKRTRWHMTPKAIDRTGIFVGRQSLIPFVFCLFLVACTPTITRKEYDQKCKEAVRFQNPLTGQVYYQPGSAV